VDRFERLLLELLTRDSAATEKRLGWVYRSSPAITRSAPAFENLSIAASEGGALCTDDGESLPASTCSRSCALSLVAVAT